MRKLGEMPLVEFAIENNREVNIFGIYGKLSLSTEFMEKDSNGCLSKIIYLYVISTYPTNRVMFPLHAKIHEV